MMGPPKAAAKAAVACHLCGAVVSAHSAACRGCKLVYCGSACLRESRDGGHRDVCDAIAAADAAATAAAADVEARCFVEGGCHVCGEATDAPVVRCCACDRGTAHVACLVAAARAATGGAGSAEGWVACAGCRRPFSGPLRLALGRACWRAYARRPEADPASAAALQVLANAVAEPGPGFAMKELAGEALPLRRAALAFAERHFQTSEACVLDAATGLAAALTAAGDFAAAVALRRRVLERRRAALGDDAPEALFATLCLSTALADSGLRAEERALLSDAVPAATRGLGATHATTIALSYGLAVNLYVGDGDERAPTLSELRESADLLAGAAAAAEASPDYGRHHASTRVVRAALEAARDELDNRERRREGSDAPRQELVGLPK